MPNELPGHKGGMPQTPLQRSLPAVDRQCSATVAGPFDAHHMPSEPSPAKHPTPSPTSAETTPHHGSRLDPPTTQASQRATTALPLWHVVMAVAVVAVWGSNFVVMKLAFDHLPPLLFGCLRYVFALVPAVFFLKRPEVPWSNLAAYGLFIGVGQFGMLYWAVGGHISPGLASLVIQTQVFFTIILAARFHHEPVGRQVWVSLALAAVGLAVIAAHTDGSTTVGGLAMVLFAAASWAMGNLTSKRAGRIDMLAYVVWASLFAVPPLFALSLALDGWPAIAKGLQEATALNWAAAIWQALGNTLFGYAVWGWLLSRHSAASVTPMALLVPVFGMGASALVLGEGLPGWKLLAAALVLSGLALNLWWPHWVAARRMA